MNGLFSRTLVAASTALVLGQAGCPSDTGSSSDSSGDAAMGEMPDVAGGEVAAAVTCADYCTALLKVCTGTHQQYADSATCLAVCGAFPQGTKGDVDGDSLSCRRFHLGEVEQSSENADEDCEVAGPSGGAECIAASADPCDGFCRDLGVVCAGANAQFAEMTACETACKTWPAGKAGDLAGNSVQCRVSHLKEVMLMPDEAAAHCPHAGANSDDCQ